MLMLSIICASRWSALDQPAVAGNHRPELIIARLLFAVSLVHIKPRAVCLKIVEQTTDEARVIGARIGAARQKGEPDHCFVNAASQASEPLPARPLRIHNLTKDIRARIIAILDHHRGVPHAMTLVDQKSRAVLIRTAGRHAILFR